MDLNIEIKFRIGEKFMINQFLTSSIKSVVALQNFTDKSEELMTSQIGSTECGRNTIHATCQRIFNFDPSSIVHV